MSDLWYKPLQYLQHITLLTQLTQLTESNLTQRVSFTSQNCFRRTLNGSLCLSREPCWACMW